MYLQMAAKNFTPATKIIAIDVQDSRLEMAKELGATHVLNSKGRDIVELIHSVTDGDGVDYALDATGNVAVVQAMIDSTANSGIAATVGGVPAGQHVKIEPGSWLARNVSYIGSCQGSSVPQKVSLEGKRGVHTRQRRSFVLTLIQIAVHPSSGRVLEARQIPHRSTHQVLLI